MASALRRASFSDNWLSERPAPKERIIVSVEEERDMSKCRRRRRPSFKEKPRGSTGMYAIHLSMGYTLTNARPDVPCSRDLLGYAVPSRMPIPGEQQMLTKPTQPSVRTGHGAI